MDIDEASYVLRVWIIRNSYMELFGLSLKSYIIKIELLCIHNSKHVDTPTGRMSVRLSYCPKTDEEFVEVKTLMLIQLAVLCMLCRVLTRH